MTPENRALIASIRAEVEQEQDALHVAVSKLLAEARQKGHLIRLIRWLLARIAP